MKIKIPKIFTGVKYIDCLKGVCFDEFYKVDINNAGAFLYKEFVFPETQELEVENLNEIVKMQYFTYDGFRCAIRKQ